MSSTLIPNPRNRLRRGSTCSQTSSGVAEDGGSPENLAMASDEVAIGMLLGSIHAALRSLDSTESGSKCSGLDSTTAVAARADRSSVILLSIRIDVYRKDNIPGVGCDGASGAGTKLAECPAGLDEARVLAAALGKKRVSCASIFPAPVLSADFLSFLLQWRLPLR